MRAVLTGLLAALVLVALTGCGPDHGTVHDKAYRAAYTSTFCSKVNKIMTCHPQYHSASYELDVYASKDDHGWVAVDAATYHHLSVGDYYNRD